MKTEEDEAFEDIERRQGGFQAKRQMAADKLQEPVAFFDWYENAIWGNEDFQDGCHRAWDAALEHTPPQREWVGLTDDELLHIGVATGLERAAAQMIADKLKEKNT